MEEWSRFPSRQEGRHAIPLLWRDDYVTWKTVNLRNELMKNEKTKRKTQFWLYYESPIKNKIIQDKH